MSCDYVANSVEPCDTCPQLITCLYMCGLLQEGAKESVKNEENIPLFSDEELDDLPF